MNRTLDINDIDYDLGKSASLRKSAPLKLIVVARRVSLFLPFSVSETGFASLDLGLERRPIAVDR